MSNDLSRACTVVLKLNLQRTHEITCRQVHHRISEVQL